MRCKTSVRKSGLLWVLLCCLGISSVQAEFKILGPVETLDNGVVTLEVALKIGRIVSYQKKGGPNWLVVEDKEPHPGWNFNPWGGDRVWPTSQMLCYQIYRNGGFDPVIDGQPWKLVSKTETSLVMQSGFSAQLGISITRRIELVKNSTEVIHSFTVEKTVESLFPVHIWTVTGVRKGECALMESDRTVEHFGWKPFKWWMDVSPIIPAASLVPKTRILRVPLLDKALKVGTYGRWVAMADDKSAFLQNTAYDAKELYLEESNLQAYGNPETAVYEIETLSPSWAMRPGEKKEWVVHWRLVDFPDGASDLAARAVFLENLIAPPL